MSQKDNDSIAASEYHDRCAAEFLGCSVDEYLRDREDMDRDYCAEAEYFSAIDEEMFEYRSLGEYDNH